ncbi:MAG TPA: arsenate reductase ArsC [Gemmatimonadales bacterium]|nr:arsenate reductase ArsC [Gemmatimonadales bacterium]
MFLCVANAGRSQVAEGLAHALAPADFRFLSAGSQPRTLNALAVRVLAEEGIDIAHHHSKGLDAIPLDQVDVIVTLCAEEVCPYVPGVVQRLHWPLPDPNDLETFRLVRDELRRRLPSLWTDQP